MRIPAPLLGPLVVGALLALATAPADGQSPDRDGSGEPRARARLSPSDVAGVEDIVRLEITVEAGGARQPPSPRATFEPENLEVVAGPAQSTSVQIVNGVASASQSLTWHLRPLAPGPARVVGIEVRAGADGWTIADQEIEIVEGSVAPRRRRSAADVFGHDPRDPFGRDPLRDFLERRQRPRRPPPAPEIYLEAEAIPSDPVVGEQVLYNLYLYTQANVRSVDPAELPDFEGFWVSLLPQPDHLEPEEVRHRGQWVHRVVLLQRALFPRRAGTFEISPLEAVLLAEVPDNSPFGSLLPRTTEIRRASNPVEVRVRELPEPRPAGFQGAVGRLRLDARLEPPTLPMGDAATLTLTLEGDGHLQGLPAPELPDVPGLRVYPPQQQGEESLRDTTVRGVRRWSYVVVPERPGTFRIPALSVPYYDPRREAWAEATAELPPIEVRGTPTLTAEDGRTLELRPIRTAALPPPGGSASFGGLGPWLFGAPWVLALAVLAVRRREAPGARPARRNLVQRLAEAEDEERPRAAAALVEDAWREFLTERFGIPPGTASPQWGGLLAERGVAPADARSLVELADDLHYLRYAPKLSSVDELRRELLERSRRLARALS